MPHVARGAHRIKGCSVCESKESAVPYTHGSVVRSRSRQSQETAADLFSEGSIYSVIIPALVPGHKTNLPDTVAGIKAGNGFPLVFSREHSIDLMIRKGIAACFTVQGNLITAPSFTDIHFLPFSSVGGDKLTGACFIHFGRLRDLRKRGRPEVLRPWQYRSRHKIPPS